MPLLHLTTEISKINAFLRDDSYGRLNRHSTAKYEREITFLVKSSTPTETQIVPFQIQINSQSDSPTYSIAKYKYFKYV